MYKIIVFLLATVLLGLVNSQQECLNNVIKYSDADKANLPVNFDAREQWPNCISPVRNQGSCSSCWAVTSTSILADRLCVQSGGAIKKLLSPQFMVDCAKNCKDGGSTYCNSGCKEGYLDISMEYLKNGVSSEQCIPYKATDGTCPSTCADNSLMQLFKGKNCVSYPTTKDAMVDIMKNGPILATFDIHSDLRDYTGGFYMGTGTQMEGHACRIIGWGNKDGTDYWLALNSWGTGWGINGAFMVPRDKNIANFENQLLSIVPDTVGSPQGADATWEGGASTGGNVDGGNGNDGGYASIINPISMTFIAITLISSLIVLMM